MEMASPSRALVDTSNTVGCRDQILAKNLGVNMFVSKVQKKHCQTKNVELDWLELSDLTY